MTQHHSSPVLFGAFIFYLILLLVFFIKNGRPKYSNWLQQHNGNTMQFRKSRAARLTCLLAAGFFPLLFAVIRHSVSPPTGFGLSFLTFDMVAGFAIFLYLSGPQDVRLDGEQRTYEWTSGWPWRPKTQRGPVDDLSGVGVTRRRSVMLIPRHCKGIYRGYALSGPLPRHAARTLAEDVARAAGLPILANIN